METPLIFLDTETATFDGPPYLLELGAVRVVDGEAVDQFESLVCPDVPIAPEASEFHGIGDEQVRQAPIVGDVLERFHEWAGDDWMFAHNAAFDARVLGYEYARAGLRPPSGRVLDTLSLARRFLPEAPNHKLGTLVEFLDLEVGALHRALEDAVCAWQVFEACAARMESPPTPESLKALAGGERTLLDSGPDEPRLSPRTRPLAEACRERRTVQLLYAGAPSAASRIEVRPRLLFRSQKKGYLEAECLRSGTLKTYRLDRIQRVTLD